MSLDKTTVDATITATSEAQTVVATIYGVDANGVKTNTTPTGTVEWNLKKGSDKFNDKLTKEAYKATVNVNKPSDGTAMADGVYTLEAVYTYTVDGKEQRLHSVSHSLSQVLSQRLR